MKKLLTLFALIIALVTLTEQATGQTLTETRFGSTIKQREYSIAYTVFDAAATDSVADITLHELNESELLLGFTIYTPTAFTGTAQDSVQFAISPNDSHTSFVTFTAVYAADSGSTSYSVWRPLGTAMQMPSTVSSTNNTIRLRATIRGKVGDWDAAATGVVRIRLLTIQL